MDKVLVAAHDPEMLESLVKGLELYTNQFEIVTAENGSDAIDILSKEKISLVVTDLLLSGIGGLQLVALMTRTYSNIPCIVMREASENPNFGDALLQKGVLQSIEKPVDFKTLASAIIEGLDLLDEGSTLQGIPAAGFFSLIQMQQETCLLQVKSSINDKGLVYFSSGILFDASCKRKKSEEAILEILSWDRVEISFLPLPKSIIQQKINSDLATLSAEAKRRKLEPEKAEDSSSKSVSQVQNEIYEDQLEAEVFIQGHSVSLDIEEEIFVEISPGKKEAVRDKLEEITGIAGFIAVGVYSIGGELLESITESSLELARVADYVFEILRNARKALGALRFADVDILDIATSNGEHFLLKGYMQGDLNFLVMIVSAHNVQIELFKEWLDDAVISLSEDLKPC